MQTTAQHRVAADTLRCASASWLTLAVGPLVLTTLIDKLGDIPLDNGSDQWNL